MKSESDNMGKRLYVTGNINALAKYLNMDEYKILSIFDFDARKTIEEIEKSTNVRHSTLFRTVFILMNKKLLNKYKILAISKV